MSDNVFSYQNSKKSKRFERRIHFYVIIYEEFSKFLLQQFFNQLWQNVSRMLIINNDKKWSCRFTKLKLN